MCCKDASDEEEDSRDPAGYGELQCSADAVSAGTPAGKPGAEAQYDPADDGDNQAQQDAIAKC